MGAGPGSSPHHYEAKLGDALTRLKDTTVPKLAYGAGSKPIKFEHWVKKVRVNLNSRHNMLVKWWDLVYSNARLAYDSYLSLSPLQRTSLRPVADDFDAVSLPCEHYMLPHMLNAVPQHVEAAACSGGASRWSGCRPWVLWPRTRVCR